MTWTHSEIAPAFDATAEGRRLCLELTQAARERFYYGSHSNLPPPSVGLGGAAIPEAQIGIRIASTANGVKWPDGINAAAIEFRLFSWAEIISMQFGITDVGWWDTASWPMPAGPTGEGWLPGFPQLYETKKFHLSAVELVQKTGASFDSSWYDPYPISFYNPTSQDILDCLAGRGIIMNTTLYQPQNHGDIPAGTIGWGRNPTRKLEWNGSAWVVPMDDSRAASMLPMLGRYQIRGRNAQNQPFRLLTRVMTADFFARMKAAIQAMKVRFVQTSLTNTTNHLGSTNQNYYDSPEIAHAAAIQNGLISSGSSHYGKASYLRSIIDVDQNLEKYAVDLRASGVVYLFRTTPSLSGGWPTVADWPVKYHAFATWYPDEPSAINSLYTYYADWSAAPAPPQGGIFHPLFQDTVGEARGISYIPTAENELMQSAPWVQEPEPHPTTGQAVWYRPQTHEAQITQVVCLAEGIFEFV